MVRHLIRLFLCGAVIVLAAAMARADERATAEAIYQASGVQGGLVVHLGCGDGTLTAALRTAERYLVQGVEVDPSLVARARRAIERRGLYGPVSVKQFDGKHLPYVDNLVNLLVVSKPFSVAPEEMMRVLCPGGVLLRLDQQEAGPGGTGLKPIRKAWPEEIDQWSHFLHDASGNAVAGDRQVGPPKGLRWKAGPRHCRSHEWPSSVGGVVTAGGRIFTIFDEGPTGVYRRLPQACRLIARDAFSGVLLWKVPLQDWQPEFGTGTGGRWNIHHTIPRRLVADDRHVYVTLRFADAPVSVLDAATGRVLVAELPGTRGTDEIILAGGILVAKITPGRSVAATERFGKEALRDSLVAIDVSTRQQLWRRSDCGVVPYGLSASGGRVVYHDMERLVCLDARSGRLIWQADCPLRWTFGGGVTLVIHRDVVLLHVRGQMALPAGAERPPAAGGKPRRGGAASYQLAAFSLDDGRLLWRRPGHPSLAGACTQPTELFVVGDVVWCGRSLQGYDLHTGQVRRQLNVWNLVSPGHHYRCFRAKATERFLIWPKRGAEFVDLENENHMRHDWLRPPCFTGLTPANGLLYVPPSQCFCYPGVLLSGFLALTATPAGSAPEGLPQVERGPAFERLRDVAIEPPRPEDWPMHRHDNRRSGATPVAVSEKLDLRWETQLRSEPTQPVVVGHRLWVAEKHRHQVHCLDARTGERLWSFIAGGRIDSAPTVAGGRVLFGCRDGWVYCLSAEDGQLAWRFRAAADSRQVVSFDQLESIWPVHGSLLVRDGVAYFAAGRSSFLDGGILVWGVDINTGRPLYRHRLEGPWPDIKTDVGTPFAMEGATPDLLVGDGRNLYMKRIKFDPSLKRLPVRQESPLGELDMGADHLVATGGFLDDSGFDRLFWMYSRWWPGFYFAQHAPKSGQLVVFDDTTTYAVKYFYRRVQWSPAFFPGEKGYLLYADQNDNEPALQAREEKVPPLRWLPDEAYEDPHRRGGRGVEKGTGWVRTRPAKWQKLVPLRIGAMVLAGDRLFAAGLPDAVPPDDPLAAFEGRLGARLQVFSARDGSLIASYPLPAPPAFDGLAAAGRQLYLATRDGRVLCFGGSWQ